MKTKIALIIIAAAYVSSAVLRISGSGDQKIVYERDAGSATLSSDPDASKLTCSGAFEAADLHVTGLNLTVADMAAKITTLETDNTQLKANDATANAKIATQEAEITQLKADMQLVFKTVGPMISPPSFPPSPPPTHWLSTAGIMCHDNFVHGGGVSVDVCAQLCQTYSGCAEFSVSSIWGCRYAKSPLGCCVNWNSFQMHDVQYWCTPGAGWSSQDHASGSLNMYMLGASPSLPPDSPASPPSSPLVSPPVLPPPEMCVYGAYLSQCSQPWRNPYGCCNGRYNSATGLCINGCTAGGGSCDWGGGRIAVCGVVSTCPEFATCT